MEGFGAFGAGGAGAPFDPIAFFKRPVVIIRCISWVFAIIVFACIAAEGWTNDGKCVLNNDSSACNFGTVVGVFAFIGVIVFLVVDTQFDNWSNIQYRKYAVVSDMVFSAFWCFMWFICFCVLAAAWGHDNPDVADVSDYVRGNMQASIAFSFFSILSFGGLTFFAIRRYRQGVHEDFTSSYNDPATLSSHPGDIGGYNPYSQSSVGGRSSDAGSNPSSYQAPPFGGSSTTNSATGKPSSADSNDVSAGYQPNY